MGFGAQLVGGLDTNARPRTPLQCRCPTRASRAHARRTHTRMHHARTHHAHACTHGSQDVLYSAHVWSKPALSGCAAPPSRALGLAPCFSQLESRARLGVTRHAAFPSSPRGALCPRLYSPGAGPGEGRRASLAACTQERSQRSTLGAPDHQGSRERQRRCGDQKEPGTRGREQEDAKLGRMGVVGGPPPRSSADTQGPCRTCSVCIFPVSRRQSPWSCEVGLGGLSPPRVEAWTQGPSLQPSRGRSE